MQMEVVTTDLGAGPRPGAIKGSRRDRLPVIAGEEPTSRSRSDKPIEMVDEVWEDMRGDEDRSTTRSGLWRADRMLAMRERYPSAVDAKRSAQYIEVATLESKNLPSTELAPGGQMKPDAVSVERRPDRCFNFGDGGDGSLCRVLGSPTHDLARRSGDQFVSDSGTEKGGE
jgi:hypothetical protein